MARVAFTGAACACQHPRGSGARNCSGRRHGRNGAGIRFRRANTTVNPLKPQAASSLVTAGIYRYTRNPMYLGLLFLLVAWAVLLSSPFALLGPVAFVTYISRFQIVPEERVLAALFGAEYAAYQAGVRRWL